MNPRAKFRVLLGATVLLSSVGDVVADLGSVTATTIMQGAKTTRSEFNGTHYTSQTKESGVLVHFGPMRKEQAKGPYDVQCFFLSRAGGESRIHSAHRQVSDLPYDAEFYSGSIAGKSSSYTRIPVDIHFTNSPRTLSGTATYSTKAKGAMAAGWVVRVLENGVVVRVEASGVELKDYATKNPESFDERAARTKATAPDPLRKPATAFGNTLLDSKPTQRQRR